MTDDEQGVRDQGADVPGGTTPGSFEDDRRNVRSEAEGGAVPGGGAAGPRAVSDGRRTFPAPDSAPSSPAPESAEPTRENPAPAGAPPAADGAGTPATSGSASAAGSTAAAADGAGSPAGPPSDDPPGAADSDVDDVEPASTPITAEEDKSGGKSKSKRDKKQGSFWKELPVLIGVALVLALIIKAFAVQAFYIPSASMENTLQIGDRVLVNKIVYHTRDIERGDIIVFNGLDSWDPEVQVSEPTNPISKALRAVGTAFGVVPGEKDYIKRVIGVPGDRVKCCDARGRITVNGAPLDEKSYLYTDPLSHQQNKPSNDAFDVTVKPGQLWVQGDHREVSFDSRQHRGDPGGGAIPESRVIGRAFVIVWPLDRIDTLPIPKTFEQPALNAAAALAPAAPLALGFLGAFPLVRIARRTRSWLTPRPPAVIKE